MLKSKKRLDELNDPGSSDFNGYDQPSSLELNNADAGPIIIREIQCCNEFIAVLPFRIESTISIPGGSDYKNEGIVVGIGPGLPIGSERCPSQLSIGDVVMFQSKTIVSEVQSMSYPYKGKALYIMSERNVLCKLPKVEFQMVE